MKFNEEQKDVIRADLNTVGADYVIYATIISLGDFIKEITKVMTGEVSREFLLDTMAKIYIHMEHIKELLAISDEEIENVVDVRMYILQKSIGRSNRHE